jgi:hypothetical protein
MNAKCALSKAALMLAVMMCAPVGHADISVSDRYGETLVYPNYAADVSYRLFTADENRLVMQGGPDLTSVSATNDRRLALEPLVVHVEERYAVSTALVRAIIDVESNCDTHAMSLTGGTRPHPIVVTYGAHYGVMEEAMRSTH